MKIALGPLHFSSVAKQSLRWTWAGAAAASALRRSPTCPAVRSSPPSRAAATPSARGASAGGARRPPRAALTARDYGGAATQGGKHSPESAERQSAAVAKADKVPSTPPPGLEPTVVSGRRVKSPAAAQRVRSDFVEISSRFRRSDLKQKGRRWASICWRDGATRSLGLFGDEQEAARAFDKAAWRLQPSGKAHGVRSGTNWQRLKLETHKQNWQRLNFPTAKEEAYAAQQGMPSAKGRHRRRQRRRRSALYRPSSG